MAKKTSKEPEAALTPEAWSYIRDLAVKRSARKVKLQDLIADRKRLEDELRECGPKRTRKREELSADYVDVLEQIEACRSKLHELADKLETAINDTVQGKLPGMQDDSEDKPETGSELYDGKKPDPQPVGKRNGQHTPAETVGA